MKNGNAFAAFTEETVRTLSGLKVVIYYAEPLPSRTDEQLQAIVARFMEGTAVQRQQFLAALAQEHRSLFGIYGHRAATLAVRQESPEWLVSGLVGAAIANYEIPEKRNVAVGLAVYHHCARKLNLAPDDVFSEAAHFAAPHVAELFTQFGQRADVTLRKFGWRELNTEEGVKYKFEWA